MAKILVPKTRNQLSLSLEGKLDRTGINTLPDISPELYEQAIRGVQERFGETFKGITFGSVALAIKTSKGKNVFLVAKEKQALVLDHRVLEILNNPSRALVALALRLEQGLPAEVRNVYTSLLDDLTMDADLRRDLSVGDGWIVASVPIEPIAQIKVGSHDMGPAFEAFVLYREVIHLLPQLDALARPYTVAPSVAA